MALENSASAAPSPSSGSVRAGKWPLLRPKGSTSAAPTTMPTATATGPGSTTGLRLTTGLGGPVGTAGRPTLGDAIAGRSAEPGSGRQQATTGPTTGDRRPEPPRSSSKIPGADRVVALAQDDEQVRVEVVDAQQKGPPAAPRVGLRCGGVVGRDVPEVVDGGGGQVAAGLAAEHAEAAQRGRVDVGARQPGQHRAVDPDAEARRAHERAQQRGHGGDEIVGDRPRAMPTAEDEAPTPNLSTDTH